jgi:hypothetical protein
MMKRIFLVLFLATTASSANASGWPWQDAPEQPLDYCAGLVVGGLHSDRMEGVSRTELWLAWGYLIRSGALKQGTTTDGFKTGRDQFSSTLDAATQQTNLDDADGSCGLGRSGHQIAGW